MATDLSARRNTPPTATLPEPPSPPESLPWHHTAADTDRQNAALESFYTTGARLNNLTDWNALLAETLVAALHLAHADSGSLMLFNDATRELTIAQAHNLPAQIVATTRVHPNEGVAGWVFAQRQPMLLLGALDATQYAGAHPKPHLLDSAICAPLLLPAAQDQLARGLGVLNLGRRLTAPRFTSADLRLVSAFCAYTATVLRNAQQYRLMQRRTEQSRSMIEIGQTLVASLEVAVVLKSIIDKAVELLHCESGSLLLIDEQTGELIFQVAVGPASAQLIGTRLPPGVGIAGTVAKNGVALIVNDAQTDPRHYREVDNSTALTTHSILCVPLIHQQHILGVVEVMNKTDGTAFDQDDRDALTILAVPSAVALANARLYSDLKRSFADTVHIITNAVEARDPYTAGHTSRVTEVALEIARELQWTREQQDILEIGALLHDIGKIGVPDLILRKPGSLTDAEYVEMKQHPILGAQMLKGVSALRPMLPYVLYHQEHYDGSGYPFGLAGTQIPIEGRVLTVADTFDAMTSNRPYRQGMSNAQAIAEIEQHRGTQFDPVVVDALLRAMANGKLQPATPAVVPDRLTASDADKC